MVTPDLLSTLLFVLRIDRQGSPGGLNQEPIAARIARARASLQVLAFLLGSAKDSVDGIRDGLAASAELGDRRAEDLVIELGALGDELQEAAIFASWMAERRDAPGHANGNEAGCESLEGRTEEDPE